MSGSNTRQGEGLLFAAAAYGWWGLVPPVYFTLIRDVPAAETLAHRIVWSIPFLALLVHLWRRWPELRRCMSSAPIVLALLLTTILIAINWYMYIYGVASKQIVQTSLGYFINPLVSVVLGMVIFRERLRGLQWLAVALATAGVVWLTLLANELPWIALSLAFSFGLYGLIRKTIPADGLVTLSVETALLLPLALGYLVWLQSVDESHFGRHGTVIDILLLLGGVVTVVPLICFGQAARLLPLSTLGFVQYLSPTCQFLVAVLLFREEVDAARLVGFCCIWAGLAVFSADTLLHYRQRRRVAEEALMTVKGQG